MPDKNKWIVISYSLPSHPSRIRVRIWRKLKKSGALYYNQSIALLPKNERSLLFMRELKNDIDSSGGEAVIADFAFIDSADNEKAASEFNSHLNNEYFCIKQTLAQIKDDIENARNNNLLSLQFLEERLAKIKKLKKSYDSISLRDYFKIRLSERIDEHIDSLLKTIKYYKNEIKSNNILQEN